MLSTIPIDLGKIKKEGLDKEILRAAIIAELDAINLYEQMADMTRNRNIRKLLLDIAREEKTHVGEFQTLLLIEDKEQVQELEKGKEEVRELLSGK
ncbi:MAG TPA: ferritin family protein [Thermodesulfobacteriota bacterium]|nr:ferritin family protein [Thermodesulfobacteriota bacterium]